MIEEIHSVEKAVWVSFYLCVLMYIKLSVA